MSKLVSTRTIENLIIRAFHSLGYIIWVHKEWGNIYHKIYEFKKKIFSKEINNSFFINLNDEDIEDDIKKKKEKAENDVKGSIKNSILYREKWKICGERYIKWIHIT